MNILHYANGLYAFIAFFFASNRTRSFNQKQPTTSAEIQAIHHDLAPFVDLVHLFYKFTG